MLLQNRSFSGPPISLFSDTSKKWFKKMKFSIPNHNRPHRNQLNPQKSRPLPNQLSTIPFSCSHLFLTHFSSNDSYRWVIHSTLSLDFWLQIINLFMYSLSLMNHWSVAVALTAVILIAVIAVRWRPFAVVRWRCPLWSLLTFWFVFRLRLISFWGWFSILFRRITNGVLNGWPIRKQK